MKVLANTFRVLDIFLEHPSELSLDELTRLSKLNKTTLSRIVRELVKYGLLMQRENRGKYSLGFKYFDFTGHIKIQLKVRDIAVPHLVKLSELVNETVILTLWTRGRAAITETFQTKYTLKVIPDEGSKLSLNTTSCGKVILAHLSAKEFDEIYQYRELERFTQNSITDFQDLKRQLATIRREGVAFDEEENTPGVRSIAAVLMNFEGNVVGAIGIIGLSLRLTRARMIELVTPVRNCAEEISRALGYPGGNHVVLAGKTNKGRTV